MPATPTTSIVLLDHRVPSSPDRRGCRHALIPAPSNTKSRSSRVVVGRVSGAEDERWPIAQLIPISSASGIEAQERLRRRFERSSNWPGARRCRDWPRRRKGLDASPGWPRGPPRARSTRHSSTPAGQPLSLVSGDVLGLFCALGQLPEILRCGHLGHLSGGLRGP